MLGLGMIAGAGATTVYTSAPTFNTAVSALLGTAGGTFTSAGLQTGNTEYIDTTTGVEFFGFADSGGTAGVADTLTVTGGILQASFDALIEVVLPTNTQGLQLSVGATSSLSTFCFDPTATFNTSGNCDATLFVSSPSSPDFVGAVDPIALSTAWVGPFTSGSPTATITSFEVYSVASATPEGPTVLLIGSGLVGLRLLRRLKRPPLPA